jgi:Zn-dependent peptidase ImmA (M78 family)
VTNEEEAEANIFAAYLLVPPSLLAKEVEKLGGRIDLTDGQQVEELAKLFDVSVPLMTARLLEDFGKANKVWQ